MAASNISFIHRKTHKNLQMNYVEEIPTKPLPEKCNFRTYLCLEQPETIDFLDYLELSDDLDGGSAVTFNSDLDDQTRKGKRVKKFVFDGIFNRVDKMVITHNTIETLLWKHDEKNG